MANTFNSVSALVLAALVGFGSGNLAYNAIDTGPVATEQAVELVVSPTPALQTQFGPAPISAPMPTPRPLELARTASVDPYAIFYAPRGAAPRTVVNHSHYNAPIVQSGQARGRSRIWGDADVDTQRTSITAIRRAARRAGMSVKQEALVLAMAWVESGFNPDAAAGTSSAQGLGQFIRKTGAAYGLTDDNRWVLEEQARALVAHTLDNIKAAEREGFDLPYVYARHHDGNFRNTHGGLDIARNRVMPKFRQFLRALRGAKQATAKLSEERAAAEGTDQGRFSLGVEANQKMARINARMAEGGLKGTASVVFEQGRKPNIEVNFSHMRDKRWTLSGVGSYDAETKDAAVGLNLQYRF